MRTGSEPVTARSPLRMRFWLSVWGLIWTGLGTAAFSFAGRTGWAVACGVLFLIVATDMVMVVRHIRQGPHYQPGRDIPPYEPDEGDGPRPGGHTGPGPDGGHGLDRTPDPDRGERADRGGRAGRRPGRRA
ncbi:MULTISPECIES: DUF6343 family protein [unclassified Streptomyces]|uniref:DUF6343 family protein n=1 Tax=unclassified Streptomyces TaxID=2593676 RepID=UPI000A8B3FCE|nr:DUF6343 family protein [Streptomyces sp. NRRL F-5135]